MGKYTIYFWPGAGYTTYPYEVIGNSEQEALRNAVIELKKRDIGNSFFMVANGKEQKEKISFFKQEFENMKKEDPEVDEDTFLTEYLNMIYMDLSEYNLENIYIKHTENLRIKEGWSKENTAECLALQPLFEFIENESWEIEQEDNSYRISQYSQAGEDYSFSIDKDIPEKFIKDICEYAENFDAEEHAEMYIGMRGTNGVPKSIRTLLDDADEIKEILMALAEQLQYNKCNFL